MARTLTPPAHSQTPNNREYTFSSTSNSEGVNRSSPVYVLPFVADAWPCSNQTDLDLQDYAGPSRRLDLALWLRE